VLSDLRDGRGGALGLAESDGVGVEGALRVRVRLGVGLRVRLGVGLRMGVRLGVGLRVRVRLRQTAGRAGNSAASVVQFTVEKRATVAFCEKLSKWHSENVIE
jgi:hypothetical protein